MNKPNLMDTRTITYLELIGNGRAYRVPEYQRDYSWTEEQWEDLWNDLLELSADAGSRHYMGALVVEAFSDREYRIIDGQQRMATLSVVALAVIGRLSELAEAGVDADANLSRAGELRNRFVGEKDPASLIESSRLYLNRTDDPFYQNYLVQGRRPLNPRSLSRSTRLLWECYQYFRTRLDQLEALQSDGASLARLLSETAARQLLFILIRVDDELNAYTVFETLNARGLELTTTDLLKNHLFSRVRVPSDLDALHRRWRALIATVGQERFPEFLRYHLLCEYPKIRTQRLFKLVRERARTPEEVFALMVALEARSELFAALSDPHHGYWVERSAARPFIRELSTYGVRQMTPLLFAAWETFSEQNFTDILRLVCVLSFRYTVVSGLNPSALEAAYHEAARRVLAGEARTPADVFNSLRQVFVQDEQFQRDFELLELNTGAQRKRLVRYILMKLEEDASGRHLDPDTDPASIEHILPENPGEDWCESIPRPHWDAVAYRVGNLTLLEPSFNRQVGNCSYVQKRAAYEASRYSLTKSLVELAPDCWTLELLEERQKQLARRATHIWRVDFSA